jgi:hypothetical protein
MLFVPNKNKNIPLVTVPETVGFKLEYVSVKTLPEVTPVLDTTKFGFIVYADEVYALNTTGVPVEPVKKPLGAALLKTLSIYDASKGTPNVLPDVESTNKGYLTCILFFSGIGAKF